MANFLLPVLGVFGLGGTELIIILLVVLLLFGGKKLPELAKGLGKSVKEFKKASEEDDEDEVAAKVRTTPAAEAKKADPANTHSSN